MSSSTGSEPSAAVPRRPNGTEPIAFMVMPFGRKDVVPQVSGAPKEIDFNALWHEVYEPVLNGLGYRPVRADADLGAIIIVEMVQRLVAADLVVADVSLPNANVYYEVGVRHAAQRTGCVLVAADWSNPVFDLSQMRRLTFPLVDGTVAPAAAAAARTGIEGGLRTLLAGSSPVFEAVPGYPSAVERSKLSAFDGYFDTLSAYQEAVTAIRDAPPLRKAQLTERLLAEFGSQEAVRAAVVVEIIELARDHLEPEQTVAYIEGLPTNVREQLAVIEQHQLALAKMGDVEGAAARLRNLIDRVGPTSDRCGLLGGRYKQLMRSARSEGDRAHWLRLAIEAYEQGMTADLNDHYPSCNLPRLYRKRGRPADERLATDTALVVVAAAQRAVTRNPSDRWVRLTLLGAAFDAGDAVKATALIDALEAEGASRFHLESTIPDLRDALGMLPAVKQEPLRAVLERVERMARRAVAAPIEEDAGGG